jgi:hypothetical protein
MTKLLRLAAGVVFLGVLALGVIAFDPACLLTRPAPWNAEIRSSLVDDLARREHLRQLEQATLYRTTAKWQITQEVIAGRRSLAEAMEQFRDLDRQWPDLRGGISKPEDLWMSEDEWDGWAVIAQVRQVLADHPDEAAAVAGRLEKELRQLLAARKKS